MRNQASIGRILALASVTLATACSAAGSPGPETTSQSNMPDPSEVWNVRELVVGDAQQSLGSWTQVKVVPGMPVGSLVLPIQVCNNPQFRVKESSDGRLVLEKTDTETADACSDDGAKVKQTAVHFFEGELTLERDGKSLTISHGTSVLHLTSQ